MIKLNRLESLLELSLRITSANSDPYKDDLKVKLFPMDLKSMIMKIQNIESHAESKTETQSSELFLNGLSSFSLDYVIKWPLSLIINRKVDIIL
jgi:gamma-tubulin complex component 2